MSRDAEKLLTEKSRFSYADPQFGESKQRFINLTYPSWEKAPEKKLVTDLWSYKLES